jgi:hypothetical protein
VGWAIYAIASGLYFQFVKASTFGGEEFSRVLAIIGHDESPAIAGDCRRRIGTLASHPRF